MLLLKAAAKLVGLVVVPFTFPWRFTAYWAVPAYYKPWINPEDWTGGWRNHPKDYQCIPKDLQPRYKGFWGFYRYHALRNGASGLRNYKWFLRKLRPEQIDVMSKGPWTFVWTRSIGMVYFDKGPVEAKFGWRLTPSDYIPNPRSFRHKYGTTPTIQMRIRPSS